MIRRLLYILAFILTIFIVQGKAAETRYFADDGNDSNDPCTTWGSPCLTVQKAEALMASGDKLLFAEGDTWDLSSDPGASFRIDQTNITINAYNRSTGVEISGESSSKPIFTGAGSYPTTDTALVASEDYMDGLTIKNIEIKEGYSSTLIGTDPGWDNATEDPKGGKALSIGRYSDNVLVQYIKVHDMWHGGIVIRNNCNDILVTDNELYNNEKWLQNAEMASPYPTFGWAGIINAEGCSNDATWDNCTISNNLIYDTFGEGIIGGDSTTITGNIVSNTSSVGIYINGQSYFSIHGNRITGTTDTTYTKHSLSIHFGLEIAVESGYSNITSGRVYNNVVTDTYAGLRLRAATGHTIDGVVLYSNTSIDNNYNFLVGNADDIGGVTPIIMKNNLFLCTNTTSCTHEHVADRPIAGITADYNLWDGDDDQAGVWDYGTDLDADLKGANDRYDNGGAISPNLLKMSSYTALSVYTDLSLPGDVTPQSGSDAIDTGATLGSPYNVDYSGTSRPVGSWYDIGALEYGGLESETFGIKGIVPTGVIFQ